MYSIFAMRILISGAGIAGPALAYWLAHYGMTPTIVEKAPKLRSAGYIIDFWGLGFDIADRMGLLPEIRRKGYMAREVRVVDRTGKRIAGFPVEAFAADCQRPLHQPCTGGPRRIHLRRDRKQSRVDFQRQRRSDRADCPGGPRYF